MKKAKLILIFTIICFVFTPKVFATNYMTINKENLKVDETFDVSINFDSIAAWEINVTSTGPVGECVINQADATANAQNTAKEFRTTCTATGAGTITITLTGNVTTAADNDEEDDAITTLNETIELTVTEEEEEKPKGLNSLTVPNGTLSPEFNNNDLENTGYTITLNSSDTSTFSINAVAKTDTDSITAKRETGIEGGNTTYENISLTNINFMSAGNDNKMKIIISVGQGERLVEYTIIVVKPVSPDFEPPELSKLAIDGEDILIDGTYNYEVTLEDKESYFITAVIKDPTNYMFSEFLVPPVETTSKNIVISVIPKDQSSGRESRDYYITIKTNTIEPVTTKKPTTTTKSGGGEVVNPQTGTPAYIVGMILISSLVLSIHLYKKNIKNYN